MAKKSNIKFLYILIFLFSQDKHKQYNAGILAKLKCANGREILL